MERIVIDLGLIDGPCPEWDRDKSSVRNADGNVCGFIDENDGARVTVILHDPVVTSDDEQGR